MKQHHGIKVGDLVKFKHHILKGDHGRLVTELWTDEGHLAQFKQTVEHIRLLGDSSGRWYLASDFDVLSRGRE